MADGDCQAMKAGSSRTQRQVASWTRCRMSDIDAELSVMGATRWVQGWLVICFARSNLRSPLARAVVLVLGQPRRAGWES